MERDFVAEIATLEENLYRGRWVNEGDYDYDHEGLWYWEPDWQTFEKTGMELRKVQNDETCPNDLKVQIARIVEKAYIKQTEAQREWEERTVPKGPNDHTSESFDETLPH